MISYPRFKEYPKFKGQTEMFLWIQERLPNKSDLSDEPLLSRNNWRWHHQFLHVLPKGSYPKWKLNPNNIILALPEEHERQETFIVFTSYKLRLTQEYYKEFYSKEF